MIHDYIDFALTKSWGLFALLGGGLFITIILVVCCTYLSHIISSHREDWQLRRQAKKGTIFLVTCDEYLRLHYAEPETCPLNDDTMYALACNDFGHIRMLERDYAQLENTLKKKAERIAKEECDQERRKIQSIMPWYGRRNTI